jgi:hypothetical protein
MALIIRAHTGHKEQDSALSLKQTYLRQGIASFTASTVLHGFQHSHYS